MSDDHPTSDPFDDESSTNPSAPDAMRPASPAPLPERIGRYRILARLGAGGMGVVYEAEQDHPRRPVALKVINPGLLSGQALRRFEHEAEVLGRLQHAGIAQIYEAGTFDLGGGDQPYFAMELVIGEPLTAYATRMKLGTRDRLSLIVKLCRAVHHAHTKGVVHRDLKPGNILVTAEGEPKILDFGVARATDADIQTTSLRTDVGQLIGTIPYMSPEQASGDPDQIDTRSDVYALGVLAYELLAGRLPYDVAKKMVHEAVRVIREDEPTRLSSINAALRGDVEIIVGKALEKERERRYQSALDLASDIERYLGDEPIEARPPSAAYQFRKFARRNKALVGGVAAVFIVLVAGVIGTTTFAVRAESARVEAVAAREAEAEQRRAAVESERRAVEEAARALAAEDVARRRAEDLNLVAEFQSNMLAQVDPSAAGVHLTEDINRRLAEALERDGATADELTELTEEFRAMWARLNATDAALTLIDETILKPAAGAIDEQFGDQPVVNAQLRQALADRYRELGLYHAASPLQTEALDIRRRTLGEEHPDTLQSMAHLGGLLHLQSRLAEAEPYIREALEKRRRVLGEEHPDTLSSINNMGMLLRFQGKLDEAELYYREAMEKLRRTLGEEHPETLVAINNLGMLLRYRGDLAGAEVYAREALEISRRVLGEDHPNTIGFINNLAVLTWSQGRLDEAEPLYRESLEKFRRNLGEEHPGTLNTINNLGVLLQSQGRLAEAEPYFLETLEKRRRLLGNHHEDTLNSINNLGVLLSAQGKLAEAEPYFRESLEKHLRLLGDQHPATILSISNLGVMLRNAGLLDEAERYLSEALERYLAVQGDRHPSTVNAFSHMAALRHLQGRSDEAVALLEPVEDAARDAFAGANALHLAAFHSVLGRARVGLGYDAEHFTLAESNLLEAHPIFAAIRGETHSDTQKCVRALVELYDAWHEAEPDAGHDAKAAEWRTELPPPEGADAATDDVATDDDEAPDSNEDPEFEPAGAS